MQKNDRIWVLCGDLGYRLWDTIRDEFPERFLNCGASEQAMVDIACGLAIEGKIPIVYTATTFLLYRPFEGIRNYIDHEKLNVKLIGSGRGRDYTHDGWSHWAQEDRKVMSLFENIASFWPETKEEIPSLVEDMLAKDKPYYINLRR